MIAFGERLRAARTAAGFSQMDVAERIGVSQPKVSVWERSDREPDRESLELLAKVLGPHLSLTPAEAAQAAPAAGFGERLRSARLAAGLSQADVSTQVGVSQPTISLWERSSREPDPEFVELLSKVLAPHLRVTRAESPEVESSQYGLWVRRTREEKGMSAAALAEKAGISVPGLYGIESGRTANPRPATRNRLARALGVSTPLAVVEATEEQSEVEGLGALQDFDPHSEQDWPGEAGVYVFYDISARPIYVGEGEVIRRRVKDHEQKFWFKRPIVDSASYIVIRDRDLRKKVEQLLIKFLKSNAVLNKQHVER